MRAAGSGGPVMRAGTLIIEGCRGCDRRRELVRVQERSYARADGVLRASWPHESAMGADELCSFFDERR